MAIAMRDPIGRNSPSRIYEFGDKIAENLQKDNEAKKAKRERSGKISGGKLGKPTLWAVLDLIGVPDVLDPYMLGKFMRGNDVEDRAIQFLTDIDPHDVEPGVEIDGVEGAILTGKFILQKESGYQGGTGYVDIAQYIGEKDKREGIYHEIKSSTKMAYDKVSASGATAKAAEKRGEVAIPAPYLHHALQLAYYCLGDDVTRGFLHYFNADDYRLCTFAINPLDYKEEIDKEIEDIRTVFLTKQLPPFEGFLPYHKVKSYHSYKEWNDLSPSEMMNKLKSEFPESYKKLHEMTI